MTETEKKVRILIDEDEFRTDKALEEFKKTPKERTKVRWQLFATLIKKSILKILFERDFSHEYLKRSSDNLDIYLDIMQHRDDMSDILIEHNNDDTINIAFTMYGGLSFLFKVLVSFVKNEESYDLNYLDYVLQALNKRQSSKIIDDQNYDTLDRVFDLFKGDLSVQCTHPIMPGTIINDVNPDYAPAIEAGIDKYIDFIEMIRCNSQQVLLLSEEENKIVDLLIAELTFAYSDPTLVTTVSRVPESEDFVLPLYNFYTESVSMLVDETKTEEGVEKRYHFYFLEYYKYEPNKTYRCDNKKIKLKQEKYYVLLRIHRQVEYIKYTWEELKEIKEKNINPTIKFQ